MLNMAAAGNMCPALAGLDPAFSSQDWVSFVNAQGDVLMTRATSLAWES